MTAIKSIKVYKSTIEQNSLCVIMCFLSLYPNKLDEGETRFCLCPIQQQTTFSFMMREKRLANKPKKKKKKEKDGQTFKMSGRPFNICLCRQPVNLTHC